MTLYTHQSSNIAKTWFLMIIFVLFIVGVGFFASEYYGDPSIVLIAIIISLIMNFTSYFYSDKIALAVSGAKEIQMKDNPELWRIMENLSITAGLPMPRLYIINDSAPNAFATGRNKKHSAVAVTTGLLDRLERAELEGVLAHELSHIGNKDILIQSVIVVLVGIVALISDWIIRVSWHRDSDNKNPVFLIIGLVLMIFAPIIATIIQLAVSRKREFLADATGALITRYPEGLASALEKISDYHSPMQKVNKATAHMFIATPFGGDMDGDGIPDKKQKVSFITKMFSTHPPIHERINALLNNR